MKPLTLIRWLLRAFVIALPLVGALMLLRGVGELRALDEAIAAQESRIDSLNAEHAKLKSELGKAREEVGNLPDSARMGYAMRSASSIGKQQDMLDGLITRCRHRIEAMGPVKETIRRRMIAVGWVTSLAWLGTLAGLWWLRRSGPVIPAA